jgi:TatD DNase family protein
MEFFDSHAHYDDERFDKDREETLEKIYKEGVTKCINIGCDIKTSENSIKLSEKYDYIYATCGIHPSEIPQSEEELWIMTNKIKELAKTNKKVVAIGEIGLDYYWNKDNKELQKKAFIAQINIANELNLPISIHTREAIDDTIEIIRNNKVNKGGILHCCPFNRELVKQGLNNGYSIAFGGTSTFKNSKNAGEIIEMVPLDKILIETDSPYLAPEPLRGTRNDSSNLKYVVNKIAEIKKVSPEEIAKITYKNACAVFHV